MKKLLGIMMAVAMVAGLAAAEVYSQNIVGFVQMEIPARGQFQLRSMPFEAGDQTLLDIFGTDQLTQDDNYLNCDRVLVWDPSTQTYQAWVQWTDGVFYKANNASQWNEGISGNPIVPIGSGFWIEPGAVENTIVLSGDVISVATQQVAIVEGMQIASNPFSSDVPLQETGFFASGATANDNYLLCDRVHVFEAGQYQAYAVWTDGIWYKANNAAQWNEGIMADVDLKLGEGFFYEGQSAMTWSETNRYLSAFE